MANQGKVMLKVPDRSVAETSSSETSSALRPQKYIALQPAQSSSVDDGPSHSACSLTSSLLGEYDDDDDDPVFLFSISMENQKQFSYHNVTAISTLPQCYTPARKNDCKE